MFVLSLKTQLLLADVIIVMDAPVMVGACIMQDFMEGKEKLRDVKGLGNRKKCSRLG